MDLAQYDKVKKKHMPVERPAFIIRYAKKAEDRAAKTGRIYKMKPVKKFQEVNVETKETKAIFTDN